MDHNERIKKLNSSSVLEMILDFLFLNRKIPKNYTIFIPRPSIAERVFIRDLLWLFNDECKLIAEKRWRFLQDRDYISNFLMEKEIIRFSSGLHSEGLRMSQEDTKLHAKCQMYLNMRKNEIPQYTNLIHSWILGLWEYRNEVLGYIHTVLKYTIDYFAVKDVDNAISLIHDKTLKRDWIFLKDLVILSHIKTGLDLMSEGTERGRDRIKNEEVPDFCNRCGAKIPDESVSCFHCGSHPKLKE